MSQVQIADLIVRPEFADRVIQLSTVKSALFQSGIITRDPAIDAFAKAEGVTFNLPFWNDLADDDASVSTDNPSDVIVPGKIGSSKDVAVKLFRTKAWSAMDITKAILGGEDPLNVIAGRIADYWQRYQQRVLIKVLTGVFADNATNDAGDMIINVATDSASAIADAERISASVVLAAKQTMGDASGELTAMVMHSVVYTSLQKQSLIAFIPNDRANIGFGTYMGYTVIVDDSVPAVAGTNRITYTTYMFGAGAIAYGEGAPKMPTEVLREPGKGNGEGQETIYSRRHFIMHPTGVKFTSSSMAGSNPTDAELATTANWDRVVSRKRVKLVAIKTNG